MRNAPCHGVSTGSGCGVGWSRAFRLHTEKSMAASAHSTHARDRASIAQINITPLVDVMLVLLVIFMIAAPALTRTLPMRLPAPAPAPAQVPRLALQVNASGEFALDGRMLSREALRGVLAEVATRVPQPVIEIATSRDADYQAFTTALSTVRASGLETVTLAR
jgi:biopolymer transport protein ExbD